MPGGRERPRRRLATLALFAAAAACARPADEALPPWTREDLALLATLRVPVTPPPSTSNRVADDPRAAELGRALFFDPGLSADGSLSCASCHKPTLYFTDGQPRAVGLARAGRNTPTVIGAAWFPFQTWDGRKDTLWSQALGPIESPEEMGSHRLLVARRVADRHGPAYESLFGALPMLPAELADLGASDAPASWERLDEALREAVTRVFVNVGKAIEAYERQLVPGRAPFDDYVDALLAGDPTGGGHLGEDAIRGLRAFVGEASCVLCHNGPLFTDQGFHNLGLPAGGEAPDPGRVDGIAELLADEFRSDGAHADGAPNPELVYLAPAFEDHVGAFKTPTLRNVDRTAPFGHAGQFADLDTLLESYREHDRVASIGHVDPILDLVDSGFDPAHMRAFLTSLTGPLPDERWITAPPRR